MALEKITEAQMDANGVCAAPDILSGSAAANKAIFDRMVRSVVAPAYNACVDAVNALQALEDGMKASEEGRKTAETGRVAAELERVAAELARVAAETKRQAAEEAREDLETGYVAQAQNASTQAKSWAVGATGTREEEDADNAKYYAEQAKKIAGGDFVPNSEKGQPNGVATLDKTGKLSGAQSRAINKNLLNNAYFGNPVDQRGGYVLLPETRVYSDEGLTNLLTTTNKFTAVVGTPTITEGYAKYINVNGVARYTEVEQAPVRGYTGEGYTIDRWREIGGTTILIEKQQVSVSGAGGQIYQYLDKRYSELEGCSVTLSALLDEVGLVSASAVLPSESTLPEWINFINIVSDDYFIQFNKDSIGMHCAVLPRTDKHIRVMAIKLELGTEQTLAHQDENGNWVLNEIPNYAETLAKCQRTARKLFAWRNYFAGRVNSEGNIEFFMPYSMRANPATINASVYFYLDGGIQGGTAVNVTFIADGSGVTGYITPASTLTVSRPVIVALGEDVLISADL